MTSPSLQRGVINYQVIFLCREKTRPVHFIACSEFDTCTQIKVDNFTEIKVDISNSRLQEITGGLILIIFGHFNPKGKISNFACRG